MAKSWLTRPGAHGEHGILAAESKGISQSCANFSGTTLIGDVVEVALGIRRAQMHSGRCLALRNGLDCANHVADASRGDRMPDLSLVRGYHQALGQRPENALNSKRFDGVVLGRRGAVRGAV